MLGVAGDHFFDVRNRHSVLRLKVDEQHTNFAPARDRLLHDQMQHDAAILAAGE